MMEPMTSPHADSARFVYIAVGIAAMGDLLFGYDLAVIAGAILFIKQQFALSPITEEVVVRAVLLGAMIGAAMHQDHPMTHGHSEHGSCGMIPSPCVGGEFSDTSGEPDFFFRRSLEQTKEATL